MTAPAGRAVPPYAVQLLARRDARRAAWRAANGNHAAYRRLMRSWIDSGKPRNSTWPDRDTTLPEVNVR